MKGENPVLGVGPLAATKLEAANINPSTGLATDYLNHFNEVIMLLEMLPAMPDCSADVLEWQPMDYESHFQSSTFTDKQLAILAYHAAPEHLRTALETCIREADGAVVYMQSKLQNADNPADVAFEIADFATNQIKPIISRASGVIHGVAVDSERGEGDEAQAEIDAMFA
ncbi:MAG: hypothetical protein HWE23_09840 [Rhodobacteraceae bacterium]|nr:hypothetical protein [Paracoccaceae bacterium]